MKHTTFGRAVWSWGGLAAVTLAAVGCKHCDNCAAAGGPGAVGFAQMSDFRSSGGDAIVRAQSPDASRFPLNKPKQHANRPKPVHNTQLVTHEGLSPEAAAIGGQGMGNYVAGPQGPVYGPGSCPGGCPTNYGPGYGAPAGYGCPPGGSCPPGYGGGYGCPPGGMGGPCGAYNVTYKDPGMNVYPQGTAPGMAGPGTPGAMIQYPYYTTKGPDDFFLDEDGKF